MPVYYFYECRVQDKVILHTEVRQNVFVEIKRKYLGIEITITCIKVQNSKNINWTYLSSSLYSGTDGIR